MNFIGDFIDIFLDINETTGSSAAQGGCVLIHRAMALKKPALQEFLSSYKTLDWGSWI